LELLAVQVFFVHTNNKVGNTTQTVIEVGNTINVQVSQADPNFPGIPPSSLTSFLSLKPEIFDPISVVITDHAGSYENKFYGSIFDGPENVNFLRICQASTLLARTLYALSNDISPSHGGIDFQSIESNCTLVQILVDCLTQNTTCEEMLSIIPDLKSIAPQYPEHYVGVYGPNMRTLYQKFIHDWVFKKASYAEASSYTYSHDAVSPNIEWVEGELFSYWNVGNLLDTEPLWTEADWTTIGLRIYKVSDPMYDYLFLVIAIIETIATIGVVLVLRKKFELWFRITRS